MDYVKELRQVLGSRPLVLPGTLVIVRDEAGRILLIDRADTAQWGLPGGYMEPGESLVETGIREVREETGLDVTGLRLHGVWSGTDYFVRYPNGDEVYKATVVYTARVAAGELTPDPEEARQARFFPVESLPGNVFDQELAIIEHYAQGLR
ncbi:NUDIX domain-containing protein [Crossiella sp. CA-258035]|uniref:NUDIX hydrolase n=1 Tax=Crossiella sp. CA-258035 TaxID=2981138 RepID=UPI0024BC786B|nr:NUDIX domain-containing protein [Crossiella sp. CA-258035]WHT15786.1 NUDIX domain-containing protein [Crossiella sp. CA-258035]